MRSTHGMVNVLNVVMNNEHTYTFSLMNYYLQDYHYEIQNIYFLKQFPIFALKPCRVGSVGSVSASRTVGREFASRPGHTKDHHKNGTNCLPA